MKIMHPTKISSPISLTDLENLEKSGVIPPAKRVQAELLFRRSITWNEWIIKSSGILGMLFFLAGVIFFFASNWKVMSPLFRFGVLEGGVVLAAVVAMWQTWKKGSGASALLVASLFTGVLLAVYGQVYQTGADAFEVYALWAGLIFIWVIISRSLALWTLWIVVAQTALILYLGQVLIPSGLPEMMGFCIVGCFNLVILAAWETLHQRDSFLWLRSEWFRPLILGAGLICFSVMPFAIDFDDMNWGDLVWLVIMLVVLYFYYRVRPNVVAVGICLMTAAGFIVFRIAQGIMQSQAEIGGLFLITLLSLLIFGGAASVLVKFNRKIKEGEKS